jgi:phosphate transport system protein
MSEHIIKRYDEELSELKQRLLEMGGLVEKMIADAMRALIERNGELAKSVIAMDHEVNRIELDVDAKAINLLALRQPAARDLRFITMAMKINTDMERIGDTAVNLCERTLELLEEPQLKPYVDLPRMATLAQEMLKKALDAFVEGNVKKAREVMEADNQIDDLYTQIFRELLTHMMADPKAISRGLRLTFVAKYLERIADHATNIAEMVSFLIEGYDIRHPRSRSEAR